MRDHYKDYHKEDLGHAKSTKNGKELSQRDYKRAQKAWWAERQVDPLWWRCPKDLVRIYVEEGGWECPVESCKMACESDRIAARDQKSGRAASGYDGLYEDDEGGYTSSAHCASCNGTAYVYNLAGDWENCPRGCVAVGSEQQSAAAYCAEGSWNSGVAYEPEYSSAYSRS